MDRDRDFRGRTLALAVISFLAVAVIAAALPVDARGTTSEGLQSLTVTYPGTSPGTVFDISAIAYASSPTATVTGIDFVPSTSPVTMSMLQVSFNGMTSTSDCAPGGGGANCTFSPGLPNGTHVTISVTTPSVFTQGLSFTVADSVGMTAPVTTGPPVVVCPPTVQIQPSTLPVGTVGASYSQHLMTNSSYLFTFSNTGNLPADLSLASNGLISGTPTAAGTSSFTVTATSGQCSYHQAYSLMVNSALASVPSDGGTPGSTTFTVPSVGSYSGVYDSVTLGAPATGSLLDSMFANQTCSGSPTAITTTPVSGLTLMTRPLNPTPGPGSFLASLNGQAGACEPFWFNVPTVAPCPSSGMKTTSASGSEWRDQVLPRRVLAGGRVHFALCGAPRRVADAFAHASQFVEEVTIGGRMHVYSGGIQLEQAGSYSGKVPSGVCRAMATGAAGQPFCLAKFGFCAKNAKGAIRVNGGRYICVVGVQPLQVLPPNPVNRPANAPRCASGAAPVTFEVSPSSGAGSPGKTYLLLPCNTPVKNGFTGARAPTGVELYDSVSYYNLLWRNGFLAPGSFPVRAPTRLGFTVQGPDSVLVTLPAGIPGTATYMIVLQMAGSDEPGNPLLTI